MFLRKSLFGVLGTILASGMIAIAQEPQPQTPLAPDENFSQDRSERVERHRERMAQREGLREGKRIGRGADMDHFLRELNLSEAQREQSRAIMQRQLDGTKSQREELLKLREKRIAGTFSTEDEARARSLHQEVRTAMEGVHEEMAGVLTAEQKAKLEELKQERKGRMEQRMKERQERRKNKPLSL